MAITSILNFLSLWLLQTSSPTPSEVPGVVSSLAPVLSTSCGFHDVFPSSSASAAMLAGWLPLGGHRFFSQLAASPGTILASASEFFLGVVNVSQAEAGHAVFSLLDLKAGQDC